MGLNAKDGLVLLVSLGLAALAAMQAASDHPSGLRAEPVREALPLVQDSPERRQSAGYKDIRLSFGLPAERPLAPAIQPASTPEPHTVRQVPPEPVLKQGEALVPIGQSEQGGSRIWFFRGAESSRVYAAASELVERIHYRVLADRQRVSDGEYVHVIQGDLP